MEKLQPTKQNDMVANNNNYKISKKKHTTDEYKNKQIHSQIHSKQKISKIEKYKKTEHDAKYTLFILITEKSEERKTT